MMKIKHLPLVPITAKSFWRAVNPEVGMQQRALEALWTVVLGEYKNERCPAPVPCWVDLAKHKQRK